MRVMLTLLLTVVLLTLAPAALAESPTPTADLPVVHIVLFWKDTCLHCHEVIDEVLPPLQAQYGSQLQVQLVEANSDAVWQQISQIAEMAGVPDELVAVPFMIIGDRVMIGSVTIRERLPEFIEEYLAAGGAPAPILPTPIPPTPVPTADPTSQTGSTAAPAISATPAPSSTPAPTATLEPTPSAATGSGNRTVQTILAIVIVAVVGVTIVSLVGGRKRI